MTVYNYPHINSQAMKKWCGLKSILATAMGGTDSIAVAAEANWFCTSYTALCMENSK